MVKHKIISETQFGFQAGKSTIDVVNKLLNLITDALENRCITLSVFLDLCKAFDCVDHKILLKKLRSYGIRGVALSWIKSYLTDRSQQVQVNNKLSRNSKLNFGVPQGSILGPILFLLYVNNVDSSIENGQIVKYCDDANLCFKSKNVFNLEINTYVELNSCIQYFENINLQSNADKTNYMVFETRHTVNEYRPAVFLDEVLLDEVDSTKFLGIFLDKGLTWNTHVDYVCKRLSLNIYVLRHIAKHCSLPVLRMAYYGLIHPHISYGVALWGSCPNASFQRIFRLQKKAIRIILRLKPRESCRDVFKDLNILPFPCVYIYETIIFCRFKCDLVRGRDVHEHNTRGRNNPRVAQHRLNLYENLPSQAGVRFMSRLPDNIKHEINTLSFKKNLKRYLAEHCFYSIEEWMMHANM